MSLCDSRESWDDVACIGTSRRGLPHPRESVWRSGSQERLKCHKSGHGCPGSGHGCLGGIELVLELHQECPGVVKLVMKLQHQRCKKVKFMMEPHHWSLKECEASIEASP